MFNLKHYLYQERIQLYMSQTVQSKSMKREYTKHDVRLSDEERAELRAFVSKGKNPSMIVRRANVILAVDLNQDRPMGNDEAARAFGLAESSVCAMKRQFNERGIDGFLKRKKRETPPIEPKITGEVQARIIQIACSEPPEGRSRWTVRLVAEKAVELQIIDSISIGSVSNILKKTKSGRI